MWLNGAILAEGAIKLSRHARIGGMVESDCAIGKRLPSSRRSWAIVTKGAARLLSFERRTAGRLGEEVVHPHYIPWKGST